jgi:hypothetical protein
MRPNAVTAECNARGQEPGNGEHCGTSTCARVTGKPEVMPPGWQIAPRPCIEWSG